ncbi:hypothetical protein FRC08_009241, partial [Ceratobasidium sp. 394]
LISNTLRLGSTWEHTSDASNVLARHHLARVARPSVRTCVISPVFFFFFWLGPYTTSLRGAPIDRADLPSLTHER